MEYKEAINICPKVTIVDIQCDINDGDIIEEIFDKNPRLKNFISDNKLNFDLLFTKENNSKSNKSAIFKVSPELRNYLVNEMNGKVFIGLMQCRLFDRYFIKKCRKCQNFGHFTNVCKSEIDKTIKQWIVILKIKPNVINA